MASKIFGYFWITILSTSNLRFYAVLGRLLSSSSLNSGGDELRILPGEESFHKPLGSSIMFTCSLTEQALSQTNGVTPEILWIDSQGKDVINSYGRLYVEEDGLDTRKLYITSIEEKDAGRFTCQTSLNGRLLRRSVTLELYKPITFVKFPSVLHPAIHTDAFIECEVTGSPYPNITWKYNGHRILHADNKYVRESNGLTVRNVTQSDEGKYSCRAEVESEGRYDERSVNLSVHIPPVMLSSMLRQEGVAGQELSIYCEAQGLPPPIYQFYKADSPVPLTTTDRIDVDEMGGTLLFRPVLNEDEAEYKCVVSNDVGTVSARGRVTVLVPPSIDSIVDGVGDEGGDVFIECQSSGDPAPQITFNKRGNNSSKYKLGNNGRVTFSYPSTGRARLVIRDVLPSDAGNYTCESSNKLGTVTKDASVVIKYKPRFSSNHITQVYTWVGQTRNMTCDWSAMPAGSALWYKRGQLITQNSTYSIVESPLSSVLQVTVRKIDQTIIYDKYTCKVTNQLGSDSIDMDLRRATAPDAPEAVHIDETLPTEVRLSVTPPGEDGGMAVLAYRVEYDGQVTEFLMEDTQEMSIKDLKPSTQYLLKVSARNEVGVGKPKQQTVTTKQTSKPYPVIITSTYISPHAYEHTLKWKTPNNGGLPINHYMFKYRSVEATVNDKSFNLTQPLEDWSTFQEIESSNNPIISYTFDHLRPNTAYQAEILAHNSLGWSSPGPAFVFLTAPGPSKLEERRQKQAGMGGGAIAVIVIAVIILFTVLVDVGCYFVNSCGITACLCVRLCPESGLRQRHGNGAGAKVKHTSEGEYEKRPLSEFGGSDTDTVKTYKSGANTEPVV